MTIKTQTNKLTKLTKLTFNSAFELSINESKVRQNKYVQTSKLFQELDSNLILGMNFSDKQLI